MVDEEHHDVVVIGGGAAGLSCALECFDIQLDTIVLEAKGALGGQVSMIRHSIRNIAELGMDGLGCVAADEANPSPSLGSSVSPTRTSRRSRSGTQGRSRRRSADRACPIQPSSASERVVGEISLRDNAWSADRDSLYSGLRDKAAKLGANAVIHVRCEQRPEGEPLPSPLFA
jgi:monoamine oxidase